MCVCLCVVCMLCSAGVVISVCMVCLLYMCQLVDYCSLQVSLHLCLADATVAAYVEHRSSVLQLPVCFYSVQAFCPSLIKKSLCHRFFLCLLLHVSSACILYASIATFVSFCLQVYVHIILTSICLCVTSSSILSSSWSFSVSACFSLCLFVCVFIFVCHIFVSHL